MIQSTSFPANDHLMELLVTIDALKRSSARRITAVLPYFGYARQDRKTAPRTPISAKLVANLITTAGANRVLTLDLHAGQIQGFFDIPVDNLFSAPVFAQDIAERYDGNIKDVTVVSPDVGGVLRARNLAKRLDVELAIIDKRREAAGVSEVMHVIGDVQGALKDHGAVSVSAYATHAVLSGAAVERVAASPLDEIVSTDSILATPASLESGRLRQLTVAPLLAEAIRRTAEEKSVSSLFN